MTGANQEVKNRETKTYSENVKNFAELMEEVATLPTDQQEKLSFYIQGYVASSQAGRSRRAEVAV